MSHAMSTVTSSCRKSPLASTIARLVKKSLADRGVPLTVNAKEIGYELRCLPPCAFDREYTRDLGVGAIELLSRGETGVLVSRQGGRCVPIRFSDLIDPETQRTRVRYVDVNSDTFRHARSLQTRIEESDLADDSMVDRLAQASGLASAAVRERYALVG